MESVSGNGRKILAWAGYEKAGAGPACVGAAASGQPATEASAALKVALGRITSASLDMSGF